MPLAIFPPHEKGVPHPSSAWVGEHKPKSPHCHPERSLARFLSQTQSKDLHFGLPPMERTSGTPTLEANPLFPWSPPLAAGPESPLQSLPLAAAGKESPCTPRHRARAALRTAFAQAPPAHSTGPMRTPSAAATSGGAPKSLPAASRPHARRTQRWLPQPGARPTPRLALPPAPAAHAARSVSVPLPAKAAPPSASPATVSPLRNFSTGPAISAICSAVTAPGL